MVDVWRSIARISLIILLFLRAFIDADVCSIVYDHTDTKHIKYGEGECYSWEPLANAFQCCTFCKQKHSSDSIGSRLFPPGSPNPFLKITVMNSLACCCYTYGEITSGTDGNLWYIWGDQVLGPEEEP